MPYPLINTQTDFDAVIVCDGDFPTNATALAIIANAKYLCCCDGAAVSCLQRGIVPDAIVGDGDSLPEEWKKKYADRLHIFTEQDYNDQTKATRFCQAQGFQSIAYIGSTGKREDHTLGNISLLLFYKRESGIDVTMITDYGYFVPACGKQTFATFPRQQVSIFNLCGCQNLRSRGLKWDAYPFSELWQGTLNEALDDEVTIDADGTYLVFRTFVGK